jgi:hypothetical protein
MIRGINNTEAIHWMKSLEKAVPPLVFQSLVQKAEQELPKKRFRQISQSLSQDLQLA